MCANNCRHTGTSSPHLMGNHVFIMGDNCLAAIQEHYSIPLNRLDNWAFFRAYISYSCLSICQCMQRDSPMMYKCECVFISLPTVRGYIYTRTTMSCCSQMQMHLY